ncbi:MAG TPA: tetraacyldisaccharide 4'-kinase [Longimicrobiales bacterium]|nr:tetraacyldisaccharide 4'-kinase [Longimicrobiales bacterium]
MADRIADDAGGESSGPANLPGAVERLWAGDGGGAVRLLGVALTPAELAYRGVTRVRNAAYRLGVAPSDVPPVPAISVGNITVGGTGKTPMVRWIVQWLRERGYTPGILHGGYAEDEPALHRLWFPDLPVVAEKNRLRGAGHAMEMGADVLVLDDAFQHRRIGRDVDLVLVAAETWTRHRRLLPRGPYREPGRSLRRADVVVVTRRVAAPTRADQVAREVRALSGRPTARALLAAERWLDRAGRPRVGEPGDAVAAAGIGRPEDFFDQAEAAGARLSRAIAYPDHFAYTRRDASALERLAGPGPLVITAKDAVKLVPLLPDVDLWILDQQVRFEEGRDRVTRALAAAVT